MKRTIQPSPKTPQAQADSTARNAKKRGQETAFDLSFTDSRGNIRAASITVYGRLDKKIAKFVSEIINEQTSVEIGIVKRARRKATKGRPMRVDL